MGKDKLITAEDTIGGVLEKHPKKAEILAENLHAVCLGCPMSQMETLGEAAEHHGVDLDGLLKDLNEE